MFRHIFLSLILAISFSAAHAAEIKWDTMGGGDVSCASYNKSCEVSFKAQNGEVVIKNTEGGLQLFVGKNQAGVLEAYSVGIEGNYPVGDSDNILIYENSGGSGCPMSLYVLQINKDSSSVLSSSFGSCSDYYKASVEEGMFVIRMPGFISPMALRMMEEEGEDVENIKVGTETFKWVNSKIIQKAE